MLENIPPSAIATPEEAALNKERTESGGWGLSDLEKWWRDRGEFLEAHGYRLRPRFRVGWKPSWLENGLKPTYCEDSLYHVVRRQSGLESGMKLQIVGFR